MADKEDLKLFLEAVRQVHARIDGLPSKADLDRVEGMVNKIDSSVDTLNLTLVGQYVTKKEQDARCEACGEQRKAEGSRRRWVAGYSVTVAVAVTGLITLLWRLKLLG